MAIVTSSLIQTLRTGYSKAFQEALAKAPTQWASVATRVPSGNSSNTYGWLGQFPKLREWTGDRVFKSIKEHGYAVTNKLYEATVDIPRTAFEDDELGVYSPLFSEMGYAAATHPDEIVFGLLAAGRTTDCYDGKKFFAADHPVYPNVDGTGSVGSRPCAAPTISPPTTSSLHWLPCKASRPTAGGPLGLASAVRPGRCLSSRPRCKPTPEKSLSPSATTWARRIFGSTRKPS